jgi:glyoxylase-like metal-dependent hydrolase (beta-lactamase superfamily II)
MLYLQSFCFSPIQENTYIIYNDQKEAAIIDPGCYYDYEKEKLSQFISEKKLNPVLLLQTHCHLDHVFGSKYVAEQYQLCMHIHPKEEVMIPMAEQSGLLWNMPFRMYNGKLAYLNDNDIVQLGEDTLKVLLLPGHSPGSIGFYSEKESWIISGDVLFRESIGRTDLPFGNQEQLLASIHNNLLPLPSNTKVYSGHGPHTTIGFEKRNNPFLQDF